MPWSGKPIYPFPEVIDAGPWTIEHVAKGGHSARSTRVFGAPLDDTPFARGVRAHELAHVRFSPARPQPKRHRVQLDTLLAVEDARVNEGAGRAGLREVLWEIDDPTQPVPDPRQNFRGATLLLVSAHGTRYYERVRAAYADAGDAGMLTCQLAERAVRAFREPPELPGFTATLAVARMLDRLLELSPPPRAMPTGLEKLVAAAAARPLGSGTATGVRPGGGRPRWGELRAVEEPPRLLACRRGRSVRALRLTEEGVGLVRPDRLLVDGRCFGRRQRVPGGSVLIDASTSMRLATRDLLAIVDAAPGALVACYDGHSTGWGIVRVLARDGFRVDDAMVAGPTGQGANVVDGPALEWLAEQPEPRVWVSDGEVRGVGDWSAPELYEDALRICRRASITRVGSATEARAVLCARTLRSAA